MIAIGISISIYIVFILWYGGYGKPMTDEKAEELIQRIWQKAELSENPDQEMINKTVSDFRELCKSDDGKAFYMVNLIRYKKEIVDGVDPMVENRKYMKGIIPLLFKYGGHPMFISNYMGRFIHPEGNDDWDDIVIIRYRSRKDMIKMAGDAAKLNLGNTKYSAIDKTQVFPVKGKITGIPIKLVATIVLIISILLSLI